MPIDIQCSSCAKKIRVPDRFSGLKAKCPNCHALLDLPGTPVAGVELAAGGIVPAAAVSSSASSSAIIKDELWTLRTVDGGQYGPVGKAEMTTWVEEGRVDATCELKSSLIDQWRPAADVYPELREEPIKAEPAAAPSAPSVAAPVDSPAPATNGSPREETSGAPVAALKPRMPKSGVYRKRGNVDLGPYPALKIASLFYTLMAWLSVAVGVLTALGMVVTAIVMIAQNPNGQMIATAIGALLAGLAFDAIWVAFLFVTLKAIGEFVQLALDVEHSVRSSAETSERVAVLLAQPSPDDDAARE